METAAVSLMGLTMKPYAKTALRYLIYGAIWIFVSDRLMQLAADSMESLTFLQTIKGWIFVVVSSIIVFVISKRAFDEEAAKEREKLAIYQTTVMGVYHITFNYINNMQIVLHEAGQSAEFNQDTLRLARESAQNATAALKRLQHLSDLTPGHIDSVLYGDEQGPAPAA